MHNRWQTCFGNISGTTLPPNKNHPVKDIHDIKTDDYDLLVLPGGVKAMEKIRLEKTNQFYFRIL